MPKWQIQIQIQRVSYVASRSLARNGAADGLVGVVRSSGRIEGDCLVFATLSSDNGLE